MSSADVMKYFIPISRCKAPQQHLLPRASSTSHPQHHIQTNHNDLTAAFLQNLIFYIFTILYHLRLDEAAISREAFLPPFFLFLPLARPSFGPSLQDGKDKVRRAPFILGSPTCRHGICRPSTSSPPSSSSPSSSHGGQGQGQFSGGRAVCGITKCAAMRNTRG
jgi:hypothetical protein